MLRAGSSTSGSLQKFQTFVNCLYYYLLFYNLPGNLYNPPGKDDIEFLLYYYFAIKNKARPVLENTKVKSRNKFLVTSFWERYKHL